MKKFLLLFLSIFSFLFAEVKNLPANSEIINSGITIIDIRTKPEWEQTGIIKDSIPLTFFDEKGRYDAQHFLDMLSGYVKKDQEFAIICRSGNRTAVVSKFLDNMGYKVINLQGGIKSLLSEGYQLQSYDK